MKQKIYRTERNRSMKKWFFLLLADLLLIGLIGCGNQSDPPDQTDTSAASTDDRNTETDHETAAETEETDPEPPLQAYEQTVSLSSNTEGIRILGQRYLASGTQLNLDWTCSGLEFVLDSMGGDLTIHAAASNPAYFRVWIDGMPWENADGALYYALEGIQDLVIPSLPTGEHTVRVLKVTGHTLSRAQFTGMTFYGSLLTDKTPPENGLYIEFVGDSICCGWGNIGDHTGAYTDQDGAQAYPYLVAGQLDADYAVTALSGQGLLMGTPGMTQGYLYASPLRDGSTEYDFARKADIVVINIGTNDYNYRDQYGIDEAEFEQAYVAFLKTVYEKNGGCLIYCLYNTMNDTFANAILNACQAVGGEAAGVYAMELTRTASGHPTLAEHSTYAAQITSYINQTKDLEVTGTFGEPAGGEWGPDADGVFRISSPGDMLAFAANAEANGWYAGKTVELTADIDMEGLTWEPLAYFKGTLEGNAHAIRNLTCRGQSRSGFITRIDGATVQNIRFENGACVTPVGGGQSYVGGIAAIAEGEPSAFRNIYVNFTLGVCTQNGVICGGYVGSVNPGVSVTFTNCVSNSSVTGLTAVGGFVGVSQVGATVTMTDCMFMGTIACDNHCAGMIGRSCGSAVLTRCVNMGKFEAITNTAAVYSRAGLLYAYTTDYSSTPRPAVPQIIVLTDCYSTVDDVLSNYAISSHTVNTGLRQFNVTIRYTDEETPTYENATQLINEEVIDAVRTLAKGEDVSFSAETFAEYDEFESWVLTGGETAYSATGTIDVMMPAAVAAMLGICPVANLQV